MIRYRNCILSLISFRARNQVINQARTFCAKAEKEENKFDDDKEKEKREKQHEFFTKRALILRGSFETIDDKNKGSYLEMIDIFINKDKARRNHVEFIYAALKNMKEFGVVRDLEVYKKLLDVMPKGKFIPTNLFQVEFQHYPKQQQCIIDLLDQMEDNGVIPDYEMEDQLINIFGRRGHPVRKFWRMMYWMPKFKNLSPWIVPNPPPNDEYELAKLAVERMCSVDLQSVVSTFHTADVESSIDDTWIVNGQSPIQRELLAKHPRERGLYIQGPFKIWLRYKCMNYYLLRSDSPPTFVEFNDQIEVDDVSDIDVPIYSLGQVKPKKNKLTIMRSVHEQKDGTIYAICCIGLQKKDTLLSWLRLLEKNGNPCLENLIVLFKLATPDNTTEIVVQTSEPVVKSDT